jgi:hypothetical protein
MGRVDELIGEQGERRLGFLARLPAPRGVDQLSPRDRQQPRFGRARDAFRRPLGERRGERFGKRVLGGGDVARARREERDQLAVARARDPFGCLARALGSARYAVQTGRTSTAP